VSTEHFSFWEWLLSLFDPPPLESMTRLQKIGRICLFVTSLFLISVFSSSLAAAGIFTIQHVYRWTSGFPALVSDLGIIFFCMVINTLCVFVLLEVKKADRKLLSRRPRSTAAGTDRKKDK